MAHTNFSQEQSGNSQQLSQEIEEEDETEPVPTSTSKKPGNSRGKRVKSMSKKSVDPEPQGETVRVRNFSQDKELLLAECFIKISEDPRASTSGTIPNRHKQDKNRNRVTNEEPELFEDDVLPRPPGMHMIVMSQRYSNSTASSGSNPTMFQEMMQQQMKIERKEKMEYGPRD
nr:hypothetical protein [Tanacetum cinerariifolium]